MTRFKSSTDLLVEKAVENGDEKPLPERPLIKTHSHLNLCLFIVPEGVLIIYKQGSAIFVGRDRKLES